MTNAIVCWRNGYVVETAADVRQALQAIESADFGLLRSDRAYSTAAASTSCRSCDGAAIRKLEPSR